MSEGDANMKDEVQAPLAAAKEARDALAAAMRSIVRTGTSDDFLAERQQCSIRNGVGVRLQQAIAAVGRVTNQVDKEPFSES